MLISNTTFLNNGNGLDGLGRRDLYGDGRPDAALIPLLLDGSYLSNAFGPGSNVEVAAGSLTYGLAPTYSTCQQDFPPTPGKVPVAGVTVTTSPPVTLDVITTAAAGPGSFAEAVTTAPSGSTILFNLPANSTIVTNAELFVAGDLTIDGGVNGVSISGNHDHRILFLQGGKVALKNLAFTNGFAQGGQGGSAYGAGNGGGGAGMGGAVFDNGGALTLSNVSFTSNVVQGGVGGSNLSEVNGNYSFDGSHNFDSNPDYTLGGSGGAGAALNGGSAAFSPTFGAGGLGGSLIRAKWRQRQRRRQRQCRWQRRHGWIRRRRWRRQQLHAYRRRRQRRLWRRRRLSGRGPQPGAGLARNSGRQSSRWCWRRRRRPGWRTVCARGNHLPRECELLKQFRDRCRAPGL